MKSFFVCLGILLTTWMAVAAGPESLLLWPDGAPGSEGRTDPEKVRVTESGEHVVAGVHQPSITVFAADGNAPRTGAAVLVIPGGGHRELWMDHEGMNVARWLRERGLSAYVLKYRLARETNSIYKIDVHAMADTRRAIRLIRHHAVEWGLEINRVGVLGFSAGGELAYMASQGFDEGNAASTDPVERQSSRPSFQALIYPGVSGGIQPLKTTPPAFLACAYNDRPDISEGLAQAYLRFKSAGVPAELHIFSSGGHGFGIRVANKKPVAMWINRFEDWLREGGFLAQP